MTVQELCSYLARFDSDTEVFFQFPTGDESSGPYMIAGSIDSAQLHKIVRSELGEWKPVDDSNDNDWTSDRKAKMVVLLT